MMCHRIGRSPTGIMGLGMSSATSRMRVPWPPHKRTTCTRHPWIRKDAGFVPRWRKMGQGVARRQTSVAEHEIDARMPPDDPRLVGCGTGLGTEVQRDCLSGKLVKRDGAAKPGMLARIQRIAPNQLT